MLYLDNAATGGSKPPAVHNAVRAAIQLCANPGRSGHRLSLACAERVLACRQLLSELFDGYGYERVVFTKNCTEALNIAILGILERGDHVITTCLEHNSVLRPLEFLKKKGVIDYSVAHLKEGKVCAEEIASLVKDNTKMAIVTSASNVTGYTPDLRKIRAALPERILLTVDGAQGAGHIPLKMKGTGIDALALAGHKGLHAMQGASALLFSERVNPNPIFHGGTGSESPNLDMPAFYPDRLESGTLSYPAICSLYEGGMIAKTHQNEHGRTLLQLTSAFYEKVGTMSAFTPYFLPNACGIVCFAHRAIPSEEIAEILSEKFSIAVRGGLHCAPLVHRELNTFPDGLVRASFSPWQGLKEVNELLFALRQISSHIF